jgi:hypothetical protein
VPLHVHLVTTCFERWGRVLTESVRAKRMDRDSILSDIVMASIVLAIPVQGELVKRVSHDMVALA